MELRIPLSPPQIVEGITLKFPAKLWRIVNNCQSGAISWESEGKSIKIQRKLFERDFLSSSVYFKTTNFPSFIRQLNIYGFRKVPATNRWQENGTMFEYKHDFFLKGHPELLTEVRRNTAVRRTQRENAFRESEDVIARSQAKFLDIMKKAQQSLPQHENGKHKDDYHPLLKGSPTRMLKYGFQGQPLQQKQGKITTVYMNPRGAACDMQMISPSRLQDQVTGLLPSINISDDEEMILSNGSDLITGNSFDIEEMCKKDPTDKISMEIYNPLEESKVIKNPILFLPSAADNGFDLTNIDNINVDQLSQDSNCSKINKELMFGCPVSKDDEYDDLDKSLTGSFGLSDDDVGLTVEQCEVNSPQINDTNMSVSNKEMDMLAESFSMADTLAQFGEEQGFLTPAYFDPGTGTVTLLLPSLCPET